MLYFSKEDFFPPPEVKKAGRASSRQMLNPPREWESGMDEEGWWKKQHFPGKPRGGMRKPTCRPDSHVLLTIQHKASHGLTFWTICCSLAHWRIKKKTWLWSFEDTEEKEEKIYQTISNGSRCSTETLQQQRGWRFKKGCVVYTCISMTEFRWVNCFKKCSGGKTLPASLTSGSSSLLISWSGGSRTGKFGVANT